jgi:hypothetical protein
MMAADMLARLIAQAENDGAGLVTIRAIAEEAGELAVERTLERLGLSDPRAHKDISELRDLLAAWRDAKKVARAAIVTWVVRALAAALLLGIAVRLHLSDRLFG